jgi:hypothetical protein
VQHHRLVAEVHARRGFQYDEARRGASDALPELRSHAWMVWVNRVEIGRALRPAR